MELAANFENETMAIGGRCTTFLVYIHVENASLFQPVMLNYHMR